MRNGGGRWRREGRRGGSVSLLFPATGKVVVFSLFLKKNVCDGVALGLDDGMSKRKGADWNVDPPVAPRESEREDESERSTFSFNPSLPSSRPHEATRKLNSLECVRGPRLPCLHSKEPSLP